MLNIVMSMLLLDKRSVFCIVLSAPVSFHIDKAQSLRAALPDFLDTSWSDKIKCFDFFIAMLLSSSWGHLPLTQQKMHVSDERSLASDA